MAPSESTQKEQLSPIIKPPAISTHATGMAFLRLTPEDSHKKESATNPMDEKTNTSHTNNTIIPTTTSGTIDHAKLSKLLHNIPRLDRFNRDESWDERWRRTRAFYGAMHAADQRREPVTEPTACPESDDVRAKMQELRKEMVEAVAGYVAQMDKLRQGDDHLLNLNGSPRVEYELKLVRE